MDFSTFFSTAGCSRAERDGTDCSPALYAPDSDHPPDNAWVGSGSGIRIPGLTFRRKSSFEELIPSLEGWGQNVLFLGQSNAGKSFFLKKLLNIVKPKRLVVISNTSPEQYRQYGMVLKHYSTMPESIEETAIHPESYVVIDDIRVMGLKHGNQRECLYKFFTMYSHHHRLNVFFLSQSFDNIKDMKINANFLYLFRFTDKANVKRYIDTLFGGKCNKSSLIYKLYEKLLAVCQKPVLAIDCSHNQYYTYCDGDSLKIDFE